MTTNTMTVSVPNQGELTEVRRRRYVVTGVAASRVPHFPLLDESQSQHCVHSAPFLIIEGAVMPACRV